jgi:predicted YcjX-like family ATPase
VKEAFLEASVRQYLTKLEERHLALIGQKKYKRTKPLEMAEKHNVSLQRIREEERRQKLLDDDAYWAARNKK